MPELPEVEITRQRLELLVVGKTIVQVVIRTHKLRTPFQSGLQTILSGRTVQKLERRGKYLLMYCDGGCLILHLGMTGFLQCVSEDQPPGAHDYFDVVLSDHHLLRFRDQRKFGTVIWVEGDPLIHPLLAGIGPEPLTEDFDGSYLYDASRLRRVAVKQFIMNSQVVAGIGNIYANEALFRAGIRPDRSAGSLDNRECDALAAAIKTVLSHSLEIGSTYRGKGNKVGYHPLEFDTYGRSGEVCRKCGALLESIRLGNRSTVFCCRCQR